MINFFKVLLLSISILLLSKTSYGHHVKGGWIGYTYLGEGSTTNTSQYLVTVYLYVDCHNSTSYTESVILGCFDDATKAQVYNQEIYDIDLQINTKKTYSPCIINKPEVCYKVYTYSAVLTLPHNASGYNLNVQFRSRVDNIINIYNSGNTGIAFFAKIPGIIDNIDYHVNNSPEFAFLDTSVVCHNGTFSLPFSASDPDGDSLSYEFGPGLDCIAANDGALQDPKPPPYRALYYANGYSGLQPLGANVSIDQRTGIISGTAPSDVGEYVVAVYVKEWRNGILIGSIKKELQIQVENCSLGSAILNPSYINCTDNTFTFSNNASLPNAVYLWNFGVPNIQSDTSIQANPTFEYPDTGTFTLKLKVTVSAECSDSTTSQIKVYPGFKPNFNTSGFCITTKTLFQDATTTRYGTLKNWAWDFGDGLVNEQSSPNATFQYLNPGNYKVILHVENSKGCSDTISHLIKINDKIKIILPFSDTTICNKDSITLLADAGDEAVYVWKSSNNNISNTQIANPIVYPKENNTYQVFADNYGCRDTASVKVNVMNDLNLDATDQKVCVGDTAYLYAVSQANKFVWQQISGTDTLSNTEIAFPSLLVSDNNTYLITASYGKNCILSKEVKVLSAPYPTIHILENADTTICIGNTLTLHAIGTATDNRWIPSNNNGFEYRATPQQNTLYITEAYNKNSYCQKKVRDSIMVNVVPAFHLILTKDTTVVFSQPLKLNLNSNYSDRNYTYSWQPAQYLDSSQIKSPTAIFPYGITKQYYTINVVDNFGCKTQAGINVNIFNTSTEIFVPSAFTPNGDGKNDLLRPTLLGIKKLLSFRVFNRWGQLVFSTNTIGNGWNGYLNGALAPSGSVYIYQVEGYDYKDKKIDKKGTSVLIR